LLVDSTQLQSTCEIINEGYTKKKLDQVCRQYEASVKHKIVTKDPPHQQGVEVVHCKLIGAHSKPHFSQTMSILWRSIWSQHFDHLQAYRELVAPGVFLNSCQKYMQAFKQKF